MNEKWEPLRDKVGSLAQEVFDEVVEHEMALARLETFNFTGAIPAGARDAAGNSLLHRMNTLQASLKARQAQGRVPRYGDDDNGPSEENSAQEKDSEEGTRRMKGLEEELLGDDLGKRKTESSLGLSRRLTRRTPGDLSPLGSGSGSGRRRPRTKPAPVAHGTDLRGYIEDLSERLEIVEAELWKLGNAPPVCEVLTHRKLRSHEKQLKAINHRLKPYRREPPKGFTAHRDLIFLPKGENEPLLSAGSSDENLYLQGKASRRNSVDLKKAKTMQVPQRWMGHDQVTVQTAPR